MNTNYSRVIPRDLFNEAKLLKCIGHLCLQIHDNNNPASISFEQNSFTDTDSFTIWLWDEGYLQIKDIVFNINGQEIDFVTQYNAKSNYPLYAYSNFCEYLVFDESGKFTPEFLEFAATL